MVIVVGRLDSRGTSLPNNNHKLPLLGRSRVGTVGALL